MDLFLRGGTDAGTVVLVLSLLLMPLLSVLPTAPAQADGVFFWSLLSADFSQVRGNMLGWELEYEEFSVLI